MARQDLGRDPRAAGRQALDHEPAVERRDAVGQPADPSRARVGTADPVVHDLDDRRAVAAVDLDVDLRRLRVLRDVREGLGDDVVRGGLDLAGKSLLEPFSINLEQVPSTRAPWIAGPSPRSVRTDG